MPLLFAPLDPAAVGEAARKAIAGPPAARMMAARGLAPLRPVDLVVALYHLANDVDATVKSAADKTAGELPEKILAGALADPSLSPRVLDFFALRVVAQAALVEAVLLNRATLDETVVELIPRLGEADLDLVAQNEERFLRCPAVIAALYMAPRARMSTVDRVVELAVRRNVHVPGIHNWPDVVSAVLGQKGEVRAVDEKGGGDDAAFSAVARVAVGDTPVARAVPVAPDDEDADLETINQEEPKKVEEEKRHVPYDELASVMARLRLA